MYVKSCSLYRQCKLFMTSEPFFLLRKELRPGTPFPLKNMLLYIGTVHIYTADVPFHIRFAIGKNRLSDRYYRKAVIRLKTAIRELYKILCKQNESSPLRKTWSSGTNFCAPSVPLCRCWARYRRTIAVYTFAAVTNILYVCLHLKLFTSIFAF